MRPEMLVSKGGKKASHSDAAASTESRDIAQKDL